MDNTGIMTYCRSKHGTTEDYPFGEGTLVFRIGDKMYALLSVDLPADQPAKITLKCDPALAVILREKYAAVQPGYYMNKSHWNTITCDGSIPDDEFFEMIDHSYDRILAGLPVKQRKALLDEAGG